MSTLDDTRWDLVSRRQPAEFLYGVMTMGIYCRPGCPSPRPKRENVRYFLSTAEAEAGGLPPCKRRAPKGERAPLPQAVVTHPPPFPQPQPAIPPPQPLPNR